MLNDEIIARMRTFEDWQDMPAADIKALIERGHTLKYADGLALDEGQVKSHFALSDHDKQALFTASQYDIMLEVGNDTDEEE